MFEILFSDINDCGGGEQEGAGRKEAVGKGPREDRGQWILEPTFTHWTLLLVCPLNCTADLVLTPFSAPSINSTQSRRGVRLGLFCWQLAPSKDLYELSRWCCVFFPQCVNMSRWSWSQPLRKLARPRRWSTQAMASWTGRPQASNIPSRK